MKKREELFVGIKNLFDSYNFNEDYPLKPIFCKKNRDDFERIIIDLFKL